MHKDHLHLIKQIIFSYRTSFFSSAKICSSSDIPDHFNLIDSGAFDSLGFVSFIVHLSESHGIFVDFSSTSIDQLTTAKAIAEHAVFGTPSQRIPNAPPSHADDWREHFLSLGISSGDTLMIHASLLRYGQGAASNANTILDALLSTVGDSGTLLMPSANIQEFKQACFDPEHTTVQKNLGSLAETLRRREQSIRSSNPLESLCGLGRHAKAICGGSSTHAYGNTSPWRISLNYDTKLLLLGVDFYYASIIHCCEVDKLVPYRKWTAIQGSVVKNNKPVHETYYLYARDSNTEYDFSRIANHPIIQETSITKPFYGATSTIAPLSSVYKASILSLTNPYFFVKE